MESVVLTLIGELGLDPVRRAGGIRDRQFINLGIEKTVTCRAGADGQHATGLGKLGVDAGDLPAVQVKRYPRWSASVVQH